MYRGIPIADPGDASAAQHVPAVSLYASIPWTQPHAPPAGRALEVHRSAACVPGFR